MKRTVPEGYVPPKPRWRPGAKLNRASRPTAVLLAFLVGALLPFFPLVSAVLLIPLLGAFFALWRGWFTRIRLPDGQVLKLTEYTVEAFELAPMMFPDRIRLPNGEEVDVCSWLHWPTFDAKDTEYRRDIE